MSNTGSLEKVRELNSESGHLVKLGLDNQIIRLERTSSSTDSLKKSLDASDFVSAGVMSFKAKSFDEGMIAAIEKILERGCGQFKGKKEFLKSLASKLKEKFPEPDPDKSTKAIQTIFAALRLTDKDFDPGTAWNESVNAFLTEFELNPNLSKPTSFYTWDEELATIFRQDRILQTPLKLLEDFEYAQAVADEIKNDAGLLDTYITFLDITQKISNPFRIQDLSILFDHDDSIQYDVEVAAVVPPIVSYEEDLLAKIIGPGNQIPENFSLIDEFIKFIKARKVSLRPTRDSGWYDFSTWNLAPLVSIETMVESKHLEVTNSYSNLLEETFRGLMNSEDGFDKAPEETSSAAPPRIQVSIEPSLSIEPLPTFYYRRGFSYKFIKNVLLAIFEESDLEKVKRTTVYGEAENGLLSELDFMQNLFFGAHRKACQDLGMDPAQTPEASLDVYECWSKEIQNDPDFNHDHRSMIPVAYDTETRKTKVVCFYGWKTEEIQVSFEKPPEVEIYDKSGNKMPRRNMWLRPTYVGNEGQTSDEISYSFTGKKLKAYYPVADEIFVDKVLDRKEFQALLSDTVDPFELRKKLTD